MSVKVIKEIMYIQRKFLWAGTTDKKSMSWVRWSLVCKLKVVEGLGIKDVAIFNRALLSKWPWRFIYEPNAIWLGILKAKYGNLRIRVLSKDVQRVASLESIWWKDIMGIGDSLQYEGFYNQIS
ncbi:unnamed protein product [Lathyrus sativus]|nr:unnamed protein product [Lathyrus sativus]